MIWILLAPLQMLMMLFCYLTNPIVCLFCDEEGELPGPLHLWQTWDDSCNPRFYAVEKAPSFLQYDYDKHYEEYQIEMPEYGRSRWRARLLNPNFTWKERIQRYCCRVLWLSRNCGYGFAFYLFGNDSDMVTCKRKDFVKDDKHYVKIVWDEEKPLWRRPWTIKSDWYYFGGNKWHLDAFHGWKLDETGNGKRHAMIANRLTPIKS